MFCFQGSPISYISPLYFTVSSKICRAFLSSWFIVLGEAFVVLVPSHVHNQWSMSSSNIVSFDLTLLNKIKLRLHLFFSVSCLYLFGNGPVIVHPNCVRTLYGVPDGSIVYLSGTVAVWASVPIRIPILLSLIWGKLIPLKRPKSLQTLLSIWIGNVGIWKSVVEVANTSKLMIGLLLSMALIPIKVSVVSIVCSWYSDATGIVTDFLSLIPKASAIVLVICVLSLPLLRRALVSMETVSENTVIGIAWSWTCGRIQLLGWLLLQV